MGVGLQGFWLVGCACLVSSCTSIESYRWTPGVGLGKAASGSSKVAASGATGGAVWAKAPRAVPSGTTPNVAGLPFYLPKAKFVVQPATGSPPRALLKVEWVPDTSAMYTANINPGWFSDVEFTLKLSEEGVLTDVTGKGTDKVASTLIAVGTLGVAAAGVRDARAASRAIDAMPQAQAVQYRGQALSSPMPAEQVMGFVEPPLEPLLCTEVARSLEDERKGVGHALLAVLSRLERSAKEREDFPFEDPATGQVSMRIDTRSLPPLIDRVRAEITGNKAWVQAFPDRFYAADASQSGWLMAASRRLWALADECGREHEYVLAAARSVCRENASSAATGLPKSAPAALVTACDKFGDTADSALASGVLEQFKKSTEVSAALIDPPACVDGSPLGAKDESCPDAAGQSVFEEELMVLKSLYALAVRDPSEFDGASADSVEKPVRAMRRWTGLFDQRVFRWLRACSKKDEALKWIKGRAKNAASRFDAMAAVGARRALIQQAAQEVHALAKMDKDEWRRRFVRDIESRLAALERAFAEECRNAKAVGQCALPPEWDVLEQAQYAALSVSGVYRRAVALRGFLERYPTGRVSDDYLTRPTGESAMSAYMQARQELSVAEKTLEVSKDVVASVPRKDDPKEPSKTGEAQDALTLVIEESTPVSSGMIVDEFCRRDGRLPTNVVVVRWSRKP